MQPLLRLFANLKKKTWFALVVVIITSLLDTAFTLVTPIIIREIINQVFYGKNFYAMKIWLPIYIGIGFLATLSRFIQRYINEYISQVMVYDLRNVLYSKIQWQSIDFFDRMETGQLISRGTSDVEAIRRLLSIGLRIFFRALCLYIGIFVLIGIMDWRFLLIVLAFAPLLFIIMYAYSRRIRPLNRLIQNKFGDLNNILAENVYGVKVVKAFAAEDFEIQKFEKENETYLQLNLKLSRYRAYITTLFPFILTFGSFVLLLLGGRAIINGTLVGGVGTLIAINTYLILLQTPTRFMAFAILQYQEGIASLNRIFEVVDMEKKIEDKPGAIEMPTIKGVIEFKGLTFSYIDGQPPILDGINLKIEKGETIAFLGTTGSGKSTIVSLVPRFYDPQFGIVLIDDYDIRKVRVDSLRKQISIVQQEAFLFARTIKENIAFGKPNARDEDIMRVAKIAQAHDFIQAYPNKYDTIVGERGVTLSGGQKQRLTIARALLLNSPILIMDDSSSALDFETENLFQEALTELLKNKTTLIVTQRLSTIKFATKIVVMDKGKIVEIGTHDDLMNRGGLYKHLYETQLIEQAEESLQMSTLAQKELAHEESMGGSK